MIVVIVVLHDAIDVTRLSSGLVSHVGCPVTDATPEPGAESRNVSCVADPELEPVNTIVVARSSDVVPLAGCATGPLDGCTHVDAPRYFAVTLFSWPRSYDLISTSANPLT